MREADLALPAIDQDALVPVIERLYGRAIRVSDWQVARVGEKSLGLSGGLFRVAGHAEGRAWSVVLKVLQPIAPAFIERFPEADRDELRHAYLWDREARLYGSGLLDHLPDGFSAATCLGLTPTEDAHWLWLEDLGDNGALWDIHRYTLAARHLGRFNGAFADPHALPRADWLSHHWVRTWSLTGFGSQNGEVLKNDAVWTHETVRGAFAPNADGRLRRLHERRAELLDTLAALPQTLCHLDAYRPNLFDRTTPSGLRETVAIDWSYVGIDAIGADLGHLVIGSLALAEYSVDFAALTAAAVPAYIAGLREVGWRGRDADVHTGFGLSAMRWVFMLRLLGAVLDPVRQRAVERWGGHPYPVIVSRAAERTEFLLDLIERAAGT